MFTFSPGIVSAERLLALLLRPDCLFTLISSAHFHSMKLCCWNVIAMRLIHTNSNNSICFFINTSVLKML